MRRNGMRYHLWFRVIIRFFLVFLSAGTAVFLISGDRIAALMEEEMGIFFESKKSDIISSFSSLENSLQQQKLTSREEIQLAALLGSDDPRLEEVLLWSDDGRFLWRSSAIQEEPVRPPVAAFDRPDFRHTTGSGKNMLVESYLHSGHYILSYRYKQNIFREKALNLLGFLSLLFLLLIIGLLVLVIPLFIRQYRIKGEASDQLDLTQDIAMNVMGHMAEMRDSSCGYHLERISQYVKLLAEALRHSPNYENYINDEYIHDLVKAAPLHDIGKSAIADSILLKPGKLEDDEYEEMKRHCQIGSQALIDAENKLPFRSFLSIAAWLAAYHHERWDGSGYPEGLEGNRIPLSARLMNLADVYDALRSNRVYRKALSHEEARDTILKGAGTQFDPEIVGAFHEVEAEFCRISHEMKD